MIMVALVYLVKHLAVNEKNRVRVPESPQTNACFYNCYKQEIKWKIS